MQVRASGVTLNQEVGAGRTQAAEELGGPWLWWVLLRTVGHISKELWVGEMGPRC